MVARRVLLGGVVALLLVASLIAGIYLLSPQEASSTTSSSSQGTTSTTFNPLLDFGQRTSTVQVGAAPYGIANDPVTGNAYVAVSGADIVAVIDSQGKVVRNITLGGAADFLAYDPSDSLLYASLIGDNSIAMVNTTLGAVVSSVSVGTSPGWLAYDPASGTVYSVDREANAISVVSGASVLKTIALQGLPFALAYDPSDGDMYVSNNAGTVFVINGTSDSMVGSIQVGGASSDLLGVAYNPTDQRVYVTSYSDDSVYVINGSAATGSISGFNEPIGIAFSTSASEMFVVNSGNDTVTATWDGASSTVPVGPSPREVVFDPSMGGILVTNYGGTTLSAIGALDISAPD